MAGDCAVGKSCLLYRFVHDEYILPPYIGTVAVDLKVRKCLWFIFRQFDMYFAPANTTL